MLYEYITENYKEAEPIFFADLPMEGVTKSALNQQLMTLCKSGKLAKYGNDRPGKAQTTPLVMTQQI